MERTNMAREAKVIEIEKEVGEGTTQNPFRLVLEYWTTDGVKIGVIPSGSISASMLSGCSGLGDKLK